MSVQWNVDGGKLTHGGLPGPVTSIMCEPYPAFWWYSSGGGLIHVDLPESLQTGAFCGCAGLEKVSIPESVKSLGKYAFAGTGLKKAKIAADCRYYNTTFPPGCEVSFYPSVLP